MEKTVKRWLQTLPEPYRTQAINNTTAAALQKRSPSLKHALLQAFVWAETPEGYEAWRDYCETLKQ